MPRDDFSAEIKDIVARRAGMVCSNPGCGQSTSGPRDDPNKSINIGVAAHITAASPGGKRYDDSISPEQRTDIENAIWLCQNCAKLIDNDEGRYTVATLRQWKANAEERARLAIDTPKRQGYAGTAMNRFWIPFAILATFGAAILFGEIFIPWNEPPKARVWPNSTDHRIAKASKGMANEFRPWEGMHTGTERTKLLEFTDLFVHCPIHFA